MGHSSRRTIRGYGIDDIGMTGSKRNDVGIKMIAQKIMVSVSRLKRIPCRLASTPAKTAERPGHPHLGYSVFDSSNRFAI